MAQSAFKPSRVIAVAVVVVAGLWIASGAFVSEPAETAAEPEPSRPEIPVQKVGFDVAHSEPHSRTIILSCTTEADQQAMAVSRAAGVVKELNVSPGSQVQDGDVVAELSDEGRTAAVRQAEALLAQRKADYESTLKLIERGQTPKNQLPELEASLAAAEAALAAAEAEADRRFVRAPVEGIVDDVPVQVGQAVQVGGQIAKIVDPDPMLAVGAVPETQRGRVQNGQSATVRLIDERIVDGEVSFVSQTAATTTRTYRVEVEIDNSDARIADGVTCEITISLDPVVATAVPRSALVFSDAGELGVRTVDAENRVAFHPVTIVEDSRQDVWVSGLDGSTRVITLGQDFVKDGDPVDAVSSSELALRTEEPAS